MLTAHNIFVDFNLEQCLETAAHGVGCDYEKQQMIEIFLWFYNSSALIHKVALHFLNSGGRISFSF